MTLFRGSVSENEQRKERHAISTARLIRNGGRAPFRPRESFCSDTDVGSGIVVVVIADAPSVAVGVYVAGAHTHLLLLLLH